MRSSSWQQFMLNPTVHSSSCSVNTAGTCANINFSVHLLEMGEYLSALARSCGVATQVLVAGNPQIANPDVVTAGLPVCIPSACCTSVQCLDAAAVGTDSSASSELLHFPLYASPPFSPNSPPRPLSLRPWFTLTPRCSRSFAFPLYTLLRGWPLYPASLSQSCPLFQSPLLLCSDSPPPVLWLLSKASWASS